MRQVPTHGLGKWLVGSTIWKEYWAEIRSRGAMGRLLAKLGCQELLEARAHLCPAVRWAVRYKYEFRVWEVTFPGFFVEERQRRPEGDPK